MYDIYIIYITILYLGCYIYGFVNVLCLIFTYICIHINYIMGHTVLEDSVIQNTEYRAGSDHSDCPEHGDCPDEYSHTVLRPPSVL